MAPGVEGVRCKGRASVSASDIGLRKMNCTRHSQGKTIDQEREALACSSKERIHVRLKVAQAFTRPEQMLRRSSVYKSIVGLPGGLKHLARARRRVACSASIKGRLSLEYKDTNARGACSCVDEFASPCSRSVDGEIDR
jgi:hypothetical protein